MTDFLIYVAAFAATVFGLVIAAKAYFNHNTKKLMVQGVKAHSLDKKNPLVDSGRYRILFLNLGFIVSIGVCLVAFEYKSYENYAIVDVPQDKLVGDIEIIDIAPSTTHEAPPLPKAKDMAGEVVEVEDEPTITQKLQDIFTVEKEPTTGGVEGGTGTGTVIVDDEPKEDEEIAIFEAFNVTEQAEFVGGMDNFYKFLKKNIKYPSQARRMEIGGKVFLSFVIEKDGTLSDIKVTKGIGAGCDEEAVRVLKMSPKWKPAKNSFRPVRQRMSIPVNFSLN